VSQDYAKAEGTVGGAVGGTVGGTMRSAVGGAMAIGGGTGWGTIRSHAIRGDMVGVGGRHVGVGVGPERGPRMP
jgi:hypothetical protein